MPKPPILDTLDWRALFDKGRDYAEWLAGGESAENQAAMEEQRQGLTLAGPVEDFLAGLPRPVHVVAIAEDWCGDVVRHVPVLQRMACVTDQLRVRYLHREEAPAVFVRFLTNGGEAIPKFIFLSKDFTECGNWGPMPERLKAMIAQGKACGDVKTARVHVAQAYRDDPSRTEVADELCRLIDIASCASADPFTRRWPG
jgi:hypothetical protein